MTRLAYLLGDLPIQVLGRLRSDRVRQLPARRASRGSWAGLVSTAGNWRCPTRDLATAWHVTKVTASSGLPWLELARLIRRVE
jgi:hypothetical protein